jgi:RHS repeat-associated protein
MVGKTTVTTADAGTVVTETRTVNSLNQVTANSIVTVTTSPSATTTVDWTFEYDLNGNMTSRSNGTDTTAYEWDQDNRLVLVTLPDSSTVAYTYDVKGRMLTRTDTAGTTTFVWDRMNCVQETDHAGDVTRYYCPNGSLMSFDRTVGDTTSTYQVHGDALTSIRKVTDSSGTVQATYDYDASGNSLPSTSDALAFPYTYVGTSGVRWDVGTGLYYMRQRWYDARVQRFMSRDSIRHINLYTYASNNPASLVDPAGLQPITAERKAEIIATQYGRLIQLASKRTCVPAWVIAVTLFYERVGEDPEDLRKDEAVHGLGHMLGIRYAGTSGTYGNVLGMGFNPGGVGIAAGIGETSIGIGSMKVRVAMEVDQKLNLTGLGNGPGQVDYSTLLQSDYWNVMFVAGYLADLRDQFLNQNRLSKYLDLYKPGCDCPCKRGDVLDKVDWGMIASEYNSGPEKNASTGTEDSEIWARGRRMVNTWDQQFAKYQNDFQ